MVTGMIFMFRIERSRNITAKYILSRFMRDEPRITARPFDFANGKLLRRIAIPRREYIGIVISVECGMWRVKSSENNNVFAIRTITQAMTAKLPACVSDNIRRRVSLSR